MRSRAPGSARVPRSTRSACTVVSRSSQSSTATPRSRRKRRASAVARRAAVPTDPSRLRGYPTTTLPTPKVINRPRRWSTRLFPWPAVKVGSPSATRRSGSLTASPTRRSPGSMPRTRPGSPPAAGASPTSPMARHLDGTGCGLREIQLRVAAADHEHGHVVGGIDPLRECAHLLEHAIHDLLQLRASPALQHGVQPLLAEVLLAAVRRLGDPVGVEEQRVARIDPHAPVHVLGVREGAEEEPALLQLHGAAVRV